MGKEAGEIVKGLESDVSFLSDLLKASPQLIYVYDHVNNRLEYATDNLFSTFGYTFEQLQAMPNSLWSIVHPDDAYLMKAHVSQMMKGQNGNPISSTFRVQHGAGHYVWINAVDRFFDRKEDGLVHRTIGFVDDVTSKVEANQALQRSVRDNAFLLESSRILSDIEAHHSDTLMRLAQYAAEYFDAVCEISVVRPSEKLIRPLAMYHSDVKVRASIQQALNTFAVQVGEGIVGNVIASGKEYIEVQTSDLLKERIAAYDPNIVPESMIYCPLVGGYSVLGAVNFTRLANQSLFTEEDFRRIRKLTEHAALFLDNAWLRESQLKELELRRTTQVELHYANNVNSFLLSISRILSDLKSDHQMTLKLLAQSVAMHFNVFCVIYMKEASGDIISPRAFFHMDPEVRKALAKSFADGAQENGMKAARHVMRTGATYIVNEATNPEALDARLAPKSFGFWPLKGQDTLGVLCLCRPISEAPFTDDEMQRAAQLASYMSIFLENILLTERQRLEIERRSIAEQKLRQSEERLRVLIENVDDVIMTVAWDGTVLSINNPKQGYSEADCVGESVYAGLDEEKKRTLHAEIEKAKTAGEPFEILVRHNGIDGTTEWYLTHYCPVAGGDMLVSVSRNITHLKESELQIMNGMTLGQEQERKRLGAELHDGVGQILSSISLELSQIRFGTSCAPDVLVKMSELGQRVTGAINEVRNISHDLMPSVLESFGLSEAIREVCQNMQERTGIRFRFDPIDIAAQYNEATETHIYRITQELVANSVRHAHCSKVHINLINHGDVLTLSVEDDGVGFDTNEASAGIGLRNIASRVSILRGTLSVESSRTSGTLVHIEFPME